MPRRPSRRGSTIRSGQSGFRAPGSWSARTRRPAGRVGSRWAGCLLLQAGWLACTLRMAHAAYAGRLGANIKTLARIRDSAFPLALMVSCCASLCAHLCRSVEKTRQTRTPCSKRTTPSFYTIITMAAPWRGGGTCLPWTCVTPQVRRPKLASMQLSQPLAVLQHCITPTPAVMCCSFLSAPHLHGVQRQAASLSRPGHLVLG